MVGTYDNLLIVFSVVVAILASYVALDLGSRVVASHGRIAARFWLTGGAFSMGTGIWSMHFIGMLAFRLPIPMSYDIPTTLLSLLIAVLASGFALYLVSRDHLKLPTLIVGGVAMGIGIFSMHYIGMAAMEMAPPIRYQPLLLSLSVLIAVIASLIAVWSAFKLRLETILTAFWKKAGSALVMGIAISGMHYTGMAAAIFAPDSVCTVSPQNVQRTWLAGTVGAFSLVFLAATMLISAFDAYLAGVFAKHTENLNGLNAELETRVAQRTVELARTNQFLKEQVAQRKAMDERITESEARLQAFINNSPSAIFIKDLAGRYVVVNKEFTRLFGLDLERILSHTDAEIFPPDEAAQFQANDARALESRAAIEVEEVARYGSGPHTSIVCKFPLFDSSGRVTALGGIVTDITERKRAEQELLTGRALLNEAQKLSHLGSWQWELANGRVIWSDELYRVLGVDPQSYPLSFESTVGLVHPDNRAEVERTIRSASESGETFTLEHRIVRPDGAVRHLRSVGELIKDAAGRSVKMAVSVLDITEQKHTEDALRASADRLQALSRRLVEVQESERQNLARELHDRVGQQLTALGINLDILNRRFPGEAGAELRSRLEDSITLVESTADAIEDVMAELRPLMLDDYGLLPALRWLSTQFIHRNGVGVAVRDTGRLERMDSAIEIALYRIVQEALTNIAKHAQAKHVDILVTNGPRGISLTVADDGIGFDSSGRDRLVKKTGWGIINMRERAQAVGGTLTIESKPGKGTRVMVIVRR